MWRGVDKVAESGDSSRETDGGAVEGYNEDFGVVGEGVCQVQVAGDEVAEDLTASVSVVVGGTGFLDISAAGD